MGWQEVTALGIVALTLGVFAWNRFRPRKPLASGFCGCGSGTNMRHQPKVIYRAKKGHRPEVIIRSD